MVVDDETEPFLSSMHDNSFLQSTRFMIFFLIALTVEKEGGMTRLLMGMKGDQNYDELEDWILEREGFQISQHKKRPR